MAKKEDESRRQNECRDEQNKEQVQDRYDRGRRARRSITWRLACQPVVPSECRMLTSVDPQTKRRPMRTASTLDNHNARNPESALVSRVSHETDWLD